MPYAIDIYGSSVGDYRQRLTEMNEAATWLCWYKCCAIGCVEVFAKKQSIIIGGLLGGLVKLGKITWHMHYFSVNSNKTDEFRCL